MRNLENCALYSSSLLPLLSSGSLHFYPVAPCTFTKWLLLLLSNSSLNFFPMAPSTFILWLFALLPSGSLHFFLVAPCSIICFYKFFFWKSKWKLNFSQNQIKEQKEILKLFEKFHLGNKIFWLNSFPLECNRNHYLPLIRLQSK